MRSRPRSLRAGLASAVAVVLLAPACATAGDPSDGAGAAPEDGPTQGRSVAPRATALPALQVRRPVRGLTQPWDVQQLPGGALLVTERETRRLLVADRRGTRALRFPSSEVWSSGETGLMSLEVDPGFRSNRRVYTCQGGFRQGGGTDVRVVAWRLDEALTRATKVRTLLAGIPTTSGRHGGCRLMIARDGSLLVGTGDAADERNPQDRGSLAGKVLRLVRTTGAPWPGNPWAEHPDRERRYVFTYGHRNVQGLAQRADGTLWSVEHGSNRDDEVNRLVRGGNYGWDPGPGYDESVPMTDTSLPGPQQQARWRSGSPTIAASGAAWVRGQRWGRYDGALAVAALKGSRVVFMKFDRRGRLLWTRAPEALQQDGRLRSVTTAPNGDLLITTANGEGDAVLRVSPRR
ncbi:PQQ-dependent sugar dehydrogenase [Nocardioides perillae]|uniref:Glucose/arabinose dehydrogenase n=1 Tax=Nocardioides perillae TaxID=1119534 RepID=A0A7Y9RVG9_9ACTN|nr:PQQ-dependent sugar dehydrogenase [Nocardioides perillae]NYG55608.1 glucose/arabinose dehydrogenase [Nocardioides perillae]